MPRGRFVIGVLGGLLLALVIISASSSSNSAFLSASDYAVQPPPRYSTSTSQTTSSLTASPATGTSNAGNYTFQVSNNTYGIIIGASPVPSRVDSLSAQPVALTGIVLLPVLAAFLFGIVLYRTSRDKND